MDPFEILLGVWEWWEEQPSSRAAVVAKERALAALGLPGNAAHEAIAQHRRRQVAGHAGCVSLPDAIQTFCNETYQEDADMSAEHLEWVLDESQARFTDRLVLLALARHADEAGQCWPEDHEIARGAQLPVETIPAVIERLRTDGRITVADAVGRRMYQIVGGPGPTEGA